MKIYLCMSTKECSFVETFKKSVMKILKQEYIVTNPFDEEMAILALTRQLSSTIFKELIQKEKDAVKLTFTLEIIETKSE